MSNNYYDAESDEEYAICAARTHSGALPFDPTSIENLILKISDQFDFRVIMSDDRAKGALLVTTGLTIAGGLLGRHYGGKLGAAVGGAIGGVCGLGVVAISMREIWKDVKAKLHELFDIVYDYLSGMGIEDYRRAAMLLTGTTSTSTELGLLLLESTSSLLGKKVLSSLTAA